MMQNSAEHARLRPHALVILSQRSRVDFARGRKGAKHEEKKKKKKKKALQTDNRRAEKLFFQYTFTFPS